MLNAQKDSGKDLTEKPTPNNYTTTAVTNGDAGKALGNNQRTPQNKRGVEPTMEMKDSLGLARVTPTQEVM